MIGAVVGSGQDSGSTAAEARPPKLSVPVPVGPLVQTPGEFRRVIVSDLQLPASASLRVELRALGNVAVQSTPLILSEPGETTVVGFFLQTREIVGAMNGDPTAFDVDAVLAVLADGVEVAPPVPFLLLRQPVASLESSDDKKFLSPLGGDRLDLRVSSLRAQSPDNLQMLLITLDPADPSEILSLECQITEITPIPLSTDVVVSGRAPAHTVPGEVVAVVRDSLAGSSTFVGRIFYRPDVKHPSPAAGPTNGGSLVTLFGQALVPLDFDTGGPAELDFDRVQVLFRKGTKEVELPPADLRRDESSSNELVFTMPASPDGRPGPVGIIVNVLGPVQNQDQGVFFYGDAAVHFGPRGSVLSGAPISIEMAAVDRPATSGADVLLLRASGGVPVVQLYSGSGNGMFSRFGPPVTAGDPSDPAQHDPVDLQAGRFDSDAVDDVIAINRGLGADARHTLVVGSPARSPPLLAAGPVVRGAAHTGRSVAGDLDGNGADDLVLVPGPRAAASAPEVWLAMPAGPARPKFTFGGNPAVGEGPFQAVALEDVDGDGPLDLVLAVGGADPAVVVAFGTGTGQFEGTRRVELAGAVPGYAPDPASPVVGVHACGAIPRSIAVVFAGLPGSGASEPTVAVLAPDGSRSYAAPVPAGVTTIGLADTPLGLSLAADLDGDGPVEMVLAASGESSRPLRLLRWENDGFRDDPDGVDLGLEPPIDIDTMQFTVAVSVTGNRPGVVLTHRVRVDSFEEHRLSTWFAGPGPRLIAADGAVVVDTPVMGLASGSFTEDPGIEPEDLALATIAGERVGEVRILANDGMGMLRESGRIEVPEMLPSTLIATPLVFTPDLIDGGSSIAVLTASGGLEILYPVQGETLPQRVSVDLRPALPVQQAALQVGDDSEIVAGDVDGDRISDLVVLLKFSGIVDPGEADAALLLVRGRNVAGPGSPLVVPPVNAATVHGSASGVVLGRFASQVGGNSRRQVALAVPRGSSTNPTDGNHVRFYRYDDLRDRFVNSHAAASNAVLLSGAAPRELLADDVDGNGVDDLFVASAGDGQLRLFLNSGSSVSGAEQEVDVSAFREVLALDLPPGMPVGLLTRDLNGDDIHDVVVSSRQAGPPLEYGVAYYLVDVLGSVSGPFPLPMSRTGNRIGTLGSWEARDANVSLVVTDLNGDRRLDFALGWDTAAPGDRNLRVLFGGAR